MAIVSTTVFAPGVRDTPLRVALGLPFVLLVPGYALVAALLPAVEDDHPRIGRLSLSIASSVIAVTVVALVLEVAGGFQFVYVVSGVCLVTLLATGVAWARRSRRGSGSRSTGSLPGALAETGRAIGGGSALSITLTAVVVATTVGAAGVVIMEPAETPTVTELYVLGERPDGSLSAGAYPTNLTVGQSSTYVVGVGTNGDQFEGTVVARLEGVTDGGNVQDGSTVVGEFPVSLDADRTHDHTERDRPAAAHVPPVPRRSEHESRRPEGQRLGIDHGRVR